MSVENNGADYISLARSNGHNLAEPEILSELLDIALLKGEYQSADRLGEKKLKKIRRKKQKWTDKEKKILRKRSAIRQETDESGNKKAIRIAQALANPRSGFDPIYKKVLENAIKNLWSLDTAEAADTLGRELVNLNEHLVSGRNELPVITFGEVQPDINKNQNSRELHIKYGFMAAGAGLVPAEAGVQLPTADPPRPQTIIVPSWSSNFSRAIRRSSTEDRGFVIPLPKGSLTVSQLSEAAIYYDDIDGSDMAKTILIPRGFNGTQRISAAIGPLAINRVFETLLQDSCETYNADIIKKAGHLVLSELGVDNKANV